ncbi:hypothetical protein [Pseudomonas sp. RIT-PI-AD]|uniref:hypothetical protein n=1 Tax=Pseudomonas sp. RIT-PI-AD TaxID=3035294 RepID=UPI0021D89B3A|nr:hypothetical protein [Pseudomonas sp. RIT-PI-AD]
MQLTNDGLDKFLKGLLSKDFLSSYNDEEKIIECLDSRDTDSFDSEWVEIDKLLTEKIADSSDGNHIESIQEHYRKAFFEKVIRITGSAELASYVSEDIELIIGAVYFSIENCFIFSLVDSYMKNIVPDNNMARVDALPNF